MTLTVNTQNLFETGTLKNLHFVQIEIDIAYFMDTNEVDLELNEEMFGFDQFDNSRVLTLSEKLNLQTMFRHFSDMIEEAYEQHQEEELENYVLSGC